MKNIISLIDPERRKKKNQLECHFCGSTMSVKYMVNIFDPVVSNKPTWVACCNKCAAMFGEGNTLTDFTIKQVLDTIDLIKKLHDNTPDGIVTDSC